MMFSNSANVNKPKGLIIVISAILTIIPFFALIDIPFYNRTNPELGGLPFFYWYQILWLFVAAALFATAGIIYNRYGGE